LEQFVVGISLQTIVTLKKIMFYKYSSCLYFYQNCVETTGCYAEPICGC